MRIEETGSEAPALGKYTLAAPSAPSRELTPRDFEGDVAKREGMGALAGVDEITMVCVPDLMALADGDDTKLRDQQGKLIAHCEMAGDRMAILDAPPDMIPQDVHEWRMKTAGYDSKYATLYWPWLEVMDPLTNRPLMVPPSGHVAGVWARTDNTRGVHKAPANEVVLGVNGLAFQITHEEQGALNQSGINCIRSFPGRGIRIWGARTLSSDPEWRYLNVRRLFNYLSESIIEGTQWAVFEPNDERLWIRLRIAVGSFLTRTWREGALFGATPEEAFYVKCDAETNPPDVIDAGQVVIEVGIAPVKPAEFVIFRISQYSAGARRGRGLIRRVADNHRDRSLRCLQRNRVPQVTSGSISAAARVSGCSASAPASTRRPPSSSTSRSTTTAGRSCARCRARSSGRTSRSSAASTRASTSGSGASRSSRRVPTSRARTATSR